MMSSRSQTILSASLALFALIASSVVISEAASGLNQSPYGASNQNLGYTPPLTQAMNPTGQVGPTNAELADLESDDDDEDGDMKNLIAGAAGNNQATVVDDPRLANVYQPQPAASVDLKTSASHHHHGHGAKGWLDMGAWTGKKGSFGWYDKHPVGKGK